MEFYVVMSDGSKFGPANLETLNQWAKEGRILPSTTIERISDGVQGPASLLPGLELPKDAVAPPQQTTPQAPPKTPEQPQYVNPYSYSGGVGPGSARSVYDTRPTYDPYHFPAELRGKFCWGAFFFNWIWGLNHRAYITLITLGLNILTWITNAATRHPVPTEFGYRYQSSPISSIFGIIGLGLAIWYGFMGFQWAWESGRFTTPEECIDCQRTWGWWALGVFLTSCLCIGAIAFMAASAITRSGGMSGRPF